MMTVLVAYTSKHGATQEISERIARNLTAAGLHATVLPVTSAGDVAAYDAVVLGSAVYFGSWMKEATRFVQHNQDELARRPVWLFSSGPIGPDTTDAEGNDILEASVPKQVAGFEESIHPRDHTVFFGKLDKGELRGVDWLIVRLPAFPAEAGDYRDWDAVDAWAERIARELTRTHVT